VRCFDSRFRGDLLTTMAAMNWKSCEDRILYLTNLARSLVSAARVPNKVHGSGTTAQDVESMCASEFLFPLRFWLIDSRVVGFAFQGEEDADHARRRLSGLAWRGTRLVTRTVGYTKLHAEHLAAVIDHQRSEHESWSSSLSSSLPFLLLSSVGL